jgi:hypothetical protein
LGDVEIAMFQVLAWPFELIFSLLPGPMCDLSDIEKVIFQGFKGPENSFSAFWLAQNATLQG